MIFGCMLNTRRKSCIMFQVRSSARPGSSRIIPVSYTHLDVYKRQLQYCVGSSYLAPGYQVEAAAAIKKLVNIPVMTVGRITDGEIAEAIVSDGSADMVCIGRASVADPHFAEKVENKKYEDIIPCISCRQGCIMHCFTDEPMRCCLLYTSRCV